MFKTLSAVVLIAAVTTFAVLPLVSAIVPSDAHADETVLVTLRPGADGGTSASYGPLGTGARQLAVDCTTHAVRYLACKVPLNGDAGNADGGGYPSCPAGATSARVPADMTLPKDVCLNSNNNVITLYREYDGGVGSCNIYLSQPKTGACP